MKFAISNLALTAKDHAHLLPRLRPMGVMGIEIAPGHVWAEESPREVARYRYDVESCGLEIVGLHDLLAGKPHLGLFGDRDTTLRTVDHLERLSAICRDLGGRTLVFGSAGRCRNGMSLEQAWAASEAFFDLLLPRIEDHGTVLCIEPTGDSEADFCVTARECRLLVDHLDHPALGFQLNAKAQVENDDSGHAAFAAVRGRLDHFQANEPGLAAFGTSGRIDHPDCRRHLAAISYKGWVTLCQNAAADNPLAALETSFKQMTDVYLRQDNLSLDNLRLSAGDESARLKLIRETLEHVRPALQDDGGDLELVGMSGDIVRVRMQGACKSCALASQTLGGIRRKLVETLGVPVRVVPVG